MESAFSCLEGKKKRYSGEAWLSTLLLYSLTDTKDGKVGKIMVFGQGHRIRMGNYGHLRKADM